MKYIIFLFIISGPAQAQQVYRKLSQLPNEIGYSPRGVIFMDAPIPVTPSIKEKPKDDCNCDAGWLNKTTYCEICRGPCDNCNMCKCTRLNKFNCIISVIQTSGYRNGKSK